MLTRDKLITLHLYRSSFASCVGSASVESGVTPWSFLPSEGCERARFYRYHGSLTTPNCSEVVVWTVFADPLALSARQVRSHPIDQSIRRFRYIAFQT